MVSKSIFQIIVVQSLSFKNLLYMLPILHGYCMHNSKIKICSWLLGAN